MGAAASSLSPAILPDDVILEILLRVPPEPIYLLRASLVCRKWRDLVLDPAFLRRFRARHHHVAPLVGFFRQDGSFVPAGEPPDRVASEHFSQLHGVGTWRVFDSRHGRVLLSAGRWWYGDEGDELELLVWDPMTGHRTYISPPRNMLLEYPAAGGGRSYFDRHPFVKPPCVRAALVCDDGEDDCHSRPFRVVLMFPNSGTMFAGVYSSQTGSWSDFTPVRGWWSSVSDWEPNSILAGNVLYWPERHDTELLGYNIGTHRMQHVESFNTDNDPFDCVQVFRAADGKLGLAAAFESSLYLFAPIATEDEDTAVWEEYKELDLDALLPPPVSSSLPPPVRRADAVGFDEDGNTIFLDMGDGVFAVQLQTLKVHKVLESGMLRPYMDDGFTIPYMSFFVAGMNANFSLSPISYEDLCIHELNQYAYRH